MVGVSTFTAMTRKPGGDEQSEPVSRAEIRSRLASWPRERLLDFAVERLMADPGLRHALTQAEALPGAEATQSQELRRAIDGALGVRYVDWREVPGYIARLERLLGDIRSFAEGYPSEGVSVLRYFVKSLPRVFDSIADEDELARFCRELAQVELALASKVAGAMSEVVQELIAVYVADVHGRFAEVPELLAEAELSGEVRREVAAIAEAIARRVARTDRHKSYALGSLAARLR
jgi:hypothetical protein